MRMARVTDMLWLATTRCPTSSVSRTMSSQGERPPDDDHHEPGREGHDNDDDGGGIPLEGEQDYLDELGDKEPEPTGEEEKEMESANEEYQKLFKDIVDTLEYKNIHFMISLKTRTAPEVEAAIRLMYVQLREGLPLQRIHSDRARELRGQGIRRWLLQRDVFPTTGEAQSPESNGKAELAVKMLKRRARTLLQSSGLPRSCWPLAMSHAAWAQDDQRLLCRLGHLWRSRQRCLDKVGSSTSTTSGTMGCLWDHQLSYVVVLLYEIQMGAT